MKQTIQDGTRCKFIFKGCLDCFPDIVCGTQITQEQFKMLEDQTCTVIGLETYTVLGNQDFEYYNIKFDTHPDTIIIGVSGYHLEKQLPIGN